MSAVLFHEPPVLTDSTAIMRASQKEALVKKHFAQGDFASYSLKNLREGIVESMWKFSGFSDELIDMHIPE